jgi:hypothetical protein
LWRGTQRQIGELSRTVTRFAEESREADNRLRDEIRVFGEEMRAADQRLRDEVQAADRQLGSGIESLVSAMGQFLAGLSQPGKTE